MALQVLSWCLVWPSPQGGSVWSPRHPSPCPQAQQGLPVVGSLPPEKPTGFHPCYASGGRICPPSRARTLGLPLLSHSQLGTSAQCVWGGGRGTQSEGLGLGLPLLGRLWSPAPLVFCFLPLSALMMLCYQATPVQRLLSAEDTGGPRRSTGPRGRDRLQPRLYSHLWH